MEWDTAAGQAVVEGAGGLVREIAGPDLRYNRPSLTNPGILAAVAEPGP
jgi:3'(2'), 5'-bisphosphate nucleotidase